MQKNILQNKNNQEAIFTKIRSIKNGRNTFFKPVCPERTLSRDVCLSGKFAAVFNIELQKEYNNFNPRKPDVKVFNDYLQKKVIRP